MVVKWMKGIANSHTRKGEQDLEKSPRRMMAPSQTAPRHWDGNQMWVGQDAPVTEAGGSSRSSMVIDTETEIYIDGKK